MILNVDIKGTWDNEDICLDDLWELDYVTDADDLRTALVIHIAGIAIERSVEFSAVTPDYVEDGDGNELTISEDGDWITEVANFATAVLERDAWQEEGMFFAYVDNSGWRFFDFDRMSDVVDNFSQEFEGDYEEFARDWMDNMGESLLAQHETHFDYESYGEQIIEDNYQVVEWGSATYLFNE